MTISALNPPAIAVASPWLAAAGVVLAGIPILIHLLRRQRCHTQPWAAMQFVRRAARRRSRRTRLEALLLLAVRTLIILFVAIALARPYVEVSGEDGHDDANVQHVIVVDTSASMAYTTGGESRFEQSLEEATRIVDSARVGDAFNLLRIGATEPLSLIRHPAYEATDVQREITRLEVTDERGRPLETLNEVLAVLNENHDVVRHELYLLTDLQASNWSLESPRELRRTREILAEICRHARVSVIDVGETAADNAAVVDVRGAARATTSRSSAIVSATIHNFGRVQRPGERVELFINGQAHDSRVVDLPAYGELTIDWDVPLPRQSDAVVEVRLDTDEFDRDDSRWQVLPGSRGCHVLLVNGQAQASSSLPDASGFLQLALQPPTASASETDTGAEPAMLPVVISDGMLLDVRLDEFDCVYLCNVPLLTEREVNLLEQFVFKGGGLVIVLGDAVRPANYNKLLYADQRRLLPGRLLGPTGDLDTTVGGFRFEVDDYTHAILAPFKGNETAGLLTTRIDRYLQTRPDDDPNTRVVLRYSSGDAAILERSYGDGRVMLVTTALDDCWGNWALWPSFVPMMHELTRYAATGDADLRERLVGEQIVRRVSTADGQRASIVLEAADGTTQSLRIQISNGAAEVVSPALRRQGPYSLRIDGPDVRVEKYVVNLDPAESDLEKLDRETLEGLFPAQSEVRYLRSWQPRSADDAVDEFARNSLSAWFLMAAFCLLLVEQLMAWRFPLGVAALGLCVTAALVGQLTGAHLTAFSVAGLTLAGIALWWRVRSGAIRESRRGSTRPT